MLKLLTIAILLAQSPGEQYCGPRKPTPCKCYTHRQHTIDAASQRCAMIKDKAARIKCAIAIPMCHEVVVSDADNGLIENGMPPQCSRHCRKAKCTCCDS